MPWHYGALEMVLTSANSIRDVKMKTVHPRNQMSRYLMFLTLGR